MQNFESISRELERRGKTDRIKQLAGTADGVKIGKMLDMDAVERAAKSGDSEALRQQLGKVLGTAEGQRLMENLRQIMKD